MKMNSLADRPGRGKANPFAYSDDNKRYYTYNCYLRRRFGQKVFKVPLNLGLSCPNRDGTKGTGGCIYCSDKLGGDFAGDPCQPLDVQFENVKRKMQLKWDGKCIAYFQAGTNTYADTGFLEAAFEKVLSFDETVGVSIATRADCIDEEKADMLGRLAEKTYLVVELGLQTVHDKTAKLINRCHSYEDFLHGFSILSERGINVCVHLINGLPGETHDMMLRSAQAVGRLKPHAVKLHLLHFIKGTRLYEMYLNGEAVPMELSEYVGTVCDQLEALPAETVIGRVTGDGDRETLAAPLWSLKKLCVMNEIDKELLRRNSFQGKYCQY